MISVNAAVICSVLLLVSSPFSSASEGSTEGSLSASLPLDVREYEGVNVLQSSIEDEEKIDDTITDIKNHDKIMDAVSSDESNVDIPKERGASSDDVGYKQASDGDMSDVQASDVDAVDVLDSSEPPNLLDVEEEGKERKTDDLNFTNSSIKEHFGTVSDLRSLAFSSIGEKNLTKTKSKKAVCSTSDAHPVVQLLNSTSLQNLFSATPNSSRHTRSPCSVVFFFSSRCKFSVAAAPYINLLKRQLKDELSVYAVDSRSEHNINAHYGVMGTPTLNLFHGGNSVAYYNGSSYTVENLKDFFHHYTDLLFPENVTLVPEDYESEILPLEEEAASVIPLISAWLFLLSVAFYGFVKSNIFDALFQAILASWREAEDHQHQD